MSNRLAIQIWQNSQWMTAATVQSNNIDRGIRAATQFDYLSDYCADHFGNPGANVSCTHPVSWEPKDNTHWPPFLLDVMPSGAGRSRWLQRLGIKDGPTADWPLLQAGSTCPPGNLRIAEFTDGTDPTSLILPPKLNTHLGFSTEELLDFGENFVECAVERGASITGCFDIQGVSPKFMLVRDYADRWHAEGALSDERVKDTWIIKFPRGNSKADKEVLQNEAPYMSVARRVGLKANHSVKFFENALFIRRFDRISDKGSSSLNRLGMESLYSLTGKTEFGASLSHEECCNALLQYTTDPCSNLIEYLKRDIINVIMGNKDNHGRNTVVLKNSDGRIELSPLFDFAPMYLDPEGISRMTRWSPSHEQGGQPDWGKVIESFTGLNGIEIDKVNYELTQYMTTLINLEDVMREEGVADSIIQARYPSLQTNLEILRSYIATTC